MASEQRILTAGTPEGLNAKIKKYLEEGWECVGGHTGLALHSQLRYAGSQHMDTIHKAEYAQTIKKDG
jgi:hypothetical protein